MLELPTHESDGGGRAMRKGKTISLDGYPVHRPQVNCPTMQPSGLKLNARGECRYHLFNRLKMNRDFLFNPL